MEKCCRIGIVAVCLQLVSAMASADGGTGQQADAPGAATAPLVFESGLSLELPVEPQRMPWPEIFPVPGTDGMPIKPLPQPSTMKRQANREHQ